MMNLKNRIFISALLLLIPSYLISCQKLSNQVDKLEFNYEISKEFLEISTEDFIKGYLLHSDGTIKTGLSANEGHLLSESMGLWLEYLLYSGNEDDFLGAVKTIEEQFLLPNNLISWRIEKGRRASTNALIDDFRIVEVLFFAGDVFHKDKYTQLAKDISKAIVENNYKNNSFVDFYDHEYKVSNDFLTISYINPRAIRLITYHTPKNNHIYHSTIEFLHSLPQKNAFYPKVYDIKSKSFTFDDVIHLVDQLYTVLHLERANINTEEFFTWVKDEFYEENRLYGRYHLENKSPAVTYESAAVYALTLIYAIERKDFNFAIDIFNRMNILRITNQEDKYFGAYIDFETEQTHSFDNLLPLLAERIMQIEEVYEKAEEN